MGGEHGRVSGWIIRNEPFRKNLTAQPVDNPAPIVIKCTTPPPGGHFKSFERCLLICARTTSCPDGVHALNKKMINDERCISKC